MLKLRYVKGADVLCLRRLMDPILFFMKAGVAAMDSTLCTIESASTMLCLLICARIRDTTIKNINLAHGVRETKPQAELCMHG